MGQHWEIQGIGRGISVMCDGVAVAGPFSNMDVARETLERRKRWAALRRRPCLCCGRAFDSEGAHNRLCDPCRDAADQVHTGRV